MSNRSNPLETMRVAAACPADWEAMMGDDRTRFCHQCELNVYNLSGMTRKEAEALITNTEGRLCVRFYRRSDGTILTRDCPVGLRAIRRRVTRIAKAFASAALGFLTGLGFDYASAPRPIVGEYVSPPAESEGPGVILFKLAPELELEPQRDIVMGRMEVVDAERAPAEKKVRKKSRRSGN